MTLITPAGKMDFEWSPKDKSLTKTASTEQAPKSDKDVLFEAAQKIVKAQAVLEESVSVEDPCDSPVPPPVAEEVVDQKPAEAKSDAVEAVQELAEKAKKAEEVAEKVG